MATECAIPEVDLLKTFAGIEDYSAIGLMLQIQAVERFRQQKSWCPSLASILFIKSVEMELLVSA